MRRRKASERKHHLAAHADPALPGRRSTLERERDVPDLLQVRRDVLARAAVAARRAHGQHAVLVDQLHACPVELGLPGIGHGLVAAEDAAHPLVEGAHLGLLHGVVEREHGSPVGHGAERLGWGSSHPLRRRVGRAQLRVARLEILQLPEQRVVGRVRDFRMVFHVVEPIVPVQGGAELGHPRLGRPPFVSALAHATLLGRKRTVKAPTKAGDT